MHYAEAGGEKNFMCVSFFFFASIRVSLPFFTSIERTL